MSYKSLIAIAVFLCIIIGAIFFFTGYNPFSHSRNNANGNNFFARLFNNTAEPVSEENKEQSAADISAGSEIDGEVILQSSREGWLTYIDPAYVFSFEFPSSFKQSAYEDDAGDIRVFENVKTGGGDSSFQIFIMPFDEEGPITAERIKKDVPQIIIHEPQEAIIGKDKIMALIFKGEDSTLGETREVWFSYGEHLYQITAPIAFDSQLVEIMETWKF